MINAGKYNKRITIYSVVKSEDSGGFNRDTISIVLQPYAEVVTTRGYTLIANNTDFEKAYTKFTIRTPRKLITRDMYIKYKDKIYTIEYLNDVNEEGIELEIQAKEVTK